jgi:hypothetical protein
MAKGKKAKGASKRERRERRFLPQSSGNPLLVKVLGGLGAAALGAGAWAQFGRSLMGVELPPYAFGPYVLAGGAAMFGGAVWLGTSNEAAVRVGSGGVAIEKSELVRVPWHAVERIVWDPERAELALRGKDVDGRDVSLTFRASVHPLAAAWIAREALARIPKVTDVPDEVSELPETRQSDGEILKLDPIQVVGMHCAQSGKVIAYEPDAVVCSQCELVYHKGSTPDECPCGASLASTSPAVATKEAP